MLIMCLSLDYRVLKRKVVQERIREREANPQGQSLIVFTCALNVSLCLCSLGADLHHNPGILSMLNVICGRRIERTSQGGLLF